MSATSVDWGEAWRQAQDARPHRNTREHWDARAPDFARHAPTSEYAEQFLAVARPDPSWTALDVGCGSGALTLSLAARCRSVTALDFAPGMLEQLSRRCQEAGVRSVTPVLGSWEDDWERLGVGTHDLAVASRSLAVRDLEAALVKLDRAARRRVCISAPVGDGPFDRRVVEAAGRTLRRGPDYLPVHNLLHQLGILATVSFTFWADWPVHASPEEALRSVRWMVRDLTGEEETRLRAWFSATLVPHPGGWRLPAPRIVRWAVMAWDKAMDAPSPTT